tara:strand:+ start:15333 stop:15761 length:429 start_codon:yes stop_codon:yes gene_type:complete
MQQIADHVARSQPGCTEALSTIDRDIIAVKWSLWHGLGDYAIRDMERLLARLKETQQGQRVLDRAVAQPLREAPDLFALEPQWDDQLWKALPIRISHCYHSRRVDGKFAGQQADGEEADALVPPWSAHAHAGPNGRSEQRAS